MPTLPNKLITVLSFALPILLLIFLSIYKLDYFGLDFDELLFANAAMGNIDGTTFISASWHGIVLMVFPYIGALKSWIYIPVFKLFEVTPWSVRIPVVLILYINIFLAFKIAKSYFNNYLSLAVLFILSIDLTFITLHRLDKGPTALETLIKLLVVLVLVQPETIRKKVLIVFLVLLGIFNKINFIWFANAVYGSFFILYFWQFIDLLKRKITIKEFFKTLFFQYNIIYAFILLCYISYINIIHIYPPSHVPTLNELINTVIFQVKIMKYAIINTRIIYLFGWSLETKFLQIFGNIVLPITILVNAFLYLSKRVRFRSFHTAFGLYCILIFIQLVLTPNATNTWHTFVIYPFLHIFILNTFYILFQPFGKIQKIFWYSLVSIWVFVNLFTQFNFFKKLDNECVTGDLFIPEMADLINYTQTRPETVIISPVWGTHPPLLATDKKHKTYFQTLLFDTWAGHELFYKINSKVLKQTDEILIIDNVLERTPQFANNFVVIDHYLFNLLTRFMKTKKQKPYLIKVIKNKCGNPVYNIYKVKDLT